MNKTKSYGFTLILFSAGLLLFNIMLAKCFAVSDDRMSPEIDQYLEPAMIIVLIVIFVVGSGMFFKDNIKSIKENSK